MAHDAGIVHRDLKPDNIMVAKNRDGSDLVKVVDFGIAKASSSDAQKETKTGMVVGTPEYMSPEQLAGDKLDGRSDLYSLGLVAFNCLTGMLPFAAETAQEAMIMRLTDKPRSLAAVRPDLSWPAALQATLDRALVRDVDDRYKSAAQFGREFSAAIADMPMTQAVEAGTMVMGAQAAAKEPVPETRITPSRPSGRTLPMEIPVAGKKPASAAASARSGSKVPMLAGVGGGLAVVVGVGLYVSGMIGGAKPASPPAAVLPDSTAQQSPSQGAADSNAQQAGGSPRTKVPASTGSSTKAPATTPTPAGPSVTARLTEWLDLIQANLESKVVARRVLGDLEGVRPALSGRNLAEWHFVELNALMVMGDSDACRAARDVKRLHTDPSRIAVANATLGDESCK